MSTLHYSDPGIPLYQIRFDNGGYPWKSISNHDTQKAQWYIILDVKTGPQFAIPAQ